MIHLLTTDHRGSQIWAYCDTPVDRLFQSGELLVPVNCISEYDEETDTHRLPEYQQNYCQECFDAWLESFE